MMTTLSRRGLITGLISFVAAPAVVRAENLMKIVRVPPRFYAICRNAYGNTVTEPVGVEFARVVGGIALKDKLSFSHLRAGVVTDLAIKDIHGTMIYQACLNHEQWVFPGDQLILNLNLEILDP